MYEKRNGEGVREICSKFEKNTRSTRSNLNLFKKTFANDSDRIEANERKPHLSLNRHDSGRSNSLQTFLSPKFDLTLNLKK